MGFPQKEYLDLCSQWLLCKPDKDPVWSAQAAHLDVHERFNNSIVGQGRPDKLAPSHAARHRLPDLVIDHVLRHDRCLAQTDSEVHHATDRWLYEGEAGLQPSERWTVWDAPIAELLILWVPQLRGEVADDNSHKSSAPWKLYCHTSDKSIWRLSH